MPKGRISRLRSGRFGLAGLLALMLGGCDQASFVITRVDVIHQGLSSSIRSAGRAFVESHGRPFAGVAAEEIAARLRLPAAYPTGFAFIARAPGPRPERDGLRLVLHFNPKGPPDGIADCARDAEAETQPPSATGFRVTATWCQGSRPLVTGFMEAPHAAADEPADFAHLMAQLIRAITN